MQRPVYCALLMTLVLWGCSDVTPNNPYPAEESDQNILYSAFSERPRFLDPAKSYDEAESTFISQIYETPLEYHYLKRPYELQPQTTTSMPSVRYVDAQNNPLPDNAPAEKIAYSIYRIQIQPGIMYAPHPAFAVDAQGQHIYFDMSKKDLEGITELKDFKHMGTRELVADDYIYEIKRLADPTIGCPVLGLMMKYMVGLEAYNQILLNEYNELEKAGKSAKELDIRKFELSGVKLIDKYTYEITIKGKYPQFIYWLAMPFFAPMPWEETVFYGQQGLIDRNIVLDWYPIGTGPFMLKDNDPNRRMTMVRNPYYRGMPYPSVGGAGDVQFDLLKDAGQKMPFLDGAVFSLETESIPLWTKFLQGYYDLSGIQSDNFEQALTLDFGNLEVTPALKNKDIGLLKSIALSEYYWGFNMKDPLVGGYTEAQQKLRQAISIAIDVEEYISIFLNDRGMPAQGILPPGVFGYQPLPEGLNTYMYDWIDKQAVRKPISYATQLLAEAGYPNGISAKTGERLVIKYDAVTRGDPLEKARFAWLKKQFAKLGIDLNIHETDWNRFRQKLEQGSFQFFNMAWLADYPDAENFLFILYGPNSKAQAEGPNSTNYKSPDFDHLFEQAKNLEDTPARAALITAMVKQAQKDAPFVWGYHPESYTLKQSWITNLKANDMARNALKYYRIDSKLRTQLRWDWNQPLVWPLLAVLLIVCALILPVALMYRYKERHQKPKRY